MSRLPSRYPAYISPHASSHEYGGTDLVRNLDYLAIRGDTVITSDRKLQNISVAQTLEPDAHNIRDIGSSSRGFRDMYLSGKATVSSLDLGELALKIEVGKFIPIAARSQEYAFVYYDDPYLICRSKVIPKLKVTVGGTDYYVEPVEHQHCSWITLKQYGFGIYQWVAKSNGIDSGEEYLGGFERRHGFPLEGLITPCILSGTFYFWTTWGGSSQTTTITGVDPTVEHTYMVVWTSSYVRLYIDDILRATNSIVVPQSPMSFFFEACAYRGTATKEAISYYRTNTFQKLS